jgi:hypothetical protein
MLTITPDTKVAELLANFPDLEPVLVAQAPAFERLRNPVLRRTVARVTSLGQAAAIAGIDARQLVIALRRAAGQPVGEDAIVSAAQAGARGPCELAAGGTDLTVDALPSLPGGAVPTETVDADAMLNAGEVPLKAIFDRAMALRPESTLDVLIAFRPIPLIDKLTVHGFVCALGRAADGRYVLRVTRRPG